MNDYINTLLKCPYCQSPRLVKAGIAQIGRYRKRYIQQYRCMNCGRRTTKPAGIKPQTVCPDYINILPECPRCIGGRLLADDRVRNKCCINCGYRTERSSYQVKPPKLIPVKLRSSLNHVPKWCRGKQKSKRDRKILLLHQSGFSNRQIGEEINMSPSQVNLICRTAK